jgi:HEAT repeat protein
MLQHCMPPFWPNENDKHHQMEGHNYFAHGGRGSYALLQKRYSFVTISRVIKEAGVSRMHVFISYKQEDIDFAMDVAARLEQVGFQTWADYKIGAGEEWRTAIDMAIKNSFALIVIMTPEAKASEYVTYEWAFGWGVGLRVIPVMLRQTVMHPRLEALQFLDFTLDMSRSWERLIEEVRAASKAPLAHTVRIPLNAPPFVRQAVMALDSASPEQRKDAIDTLVKAKGTTDVCGVLIEALKHPIIDVRHHAAMAIGKIKDPSAVPALIEALHDSDPDLYSYATDALLEINDPSATSALIQALHDENVQVRRSAAQALGEIKDPSAAPALIEALHDPDLDLHKRATLALIALNDGSAVAPLLDALRDPQKRVRDSAAEVLNSIKHHSAIPAFMQALHHSEARARKVAAQRLGKVGHPSAVPALIAALHDSEESVRRSAAQALGQIGDPSAVPALIAALHDSKAHVRQDAINSLHLIADPSAVLALKEALADSDERVRKAARETLDELYSVPENIG